MTWDVFVSYASEDKTFARKIARGLQEAGLKVWFDEFALEAGDSLRRSIDRGVKDSEYGVVILSPSFFKKEWPQKELDGLIARDDGQKKVIIPIWYKATADDVRDYSPSLADKLSIYYAGSLRGVLTKILRAIYKDKSGSSTWKPQFWAFEDGTEFSVLPMKPLSGNALCIGRHPVSNREYERFVKATHNREPVGEHYVDGEWRGPFAPWEATDFNDPDKPVVCVDLLDAIKYCGWVSQRRMNVSLPNASLWDLVVTGMQSHRSYNSPFSLIEEDKVHHKSSCPTTIDRSGERANSLGISDMFGNVWEWCGRNIYRRIPNYPRLGDPRYAIGEAEIRGGSFLDDLQNVYPILSSRMLEDGLRTRHTDLGFRLAAMVDISCLPKETVTLLDLQPFFDRRFFERVRYEELYFDDE